jgi:hypothetical protein
MKPYYWLVLAVAAVLLLPVLVTPAGWMLAAVLVVGWLILSIGGRWIVSEYVDLKKEREKGMTTKRLSDKISGDDERYRR